MRFQLLKLILWPRSDRLEPRVVEFEPGRLNVITGASKTGKSAVIPILDYCLASERCAIPVNTIRDACSWFGVVLQTPVGQMLLARREPGDQQATGDMYVAEALQVDVPRGTPQKNNTAEAVKRTLDRLAGLSNLSFDPSGVGGGFTGRPSFRDMLAFVFQPQNIVANPDILFYKADTTEHREKLRTIFPYVLGAVSPDLLAKRWQIDQIERELRRKQRELNALQETSAAWSGRLGVWVSEARELGLVEPAEASAAIEKNALLPVLRGVAQKSSSDTDLTVGSVEASARELSDIQSEESVVAAEMVQLRARLASMENLRSAVGAYSVAIDKQRDRLQLSRWLRELAGEECPLCGSAPASARDELDQLCEALANIEGESRQLSPAPAAFDRELSQVGESVRHTADRYRAVQMRRKSAIERSARLQVERYQAASVDRFIGRLQQALELLEAPTADLMLESEVSDLAARLGALRAEVSEARIRARQDDALRRISASMAQILPRLDTERPDDRAELNIKDLTISVTGPEGRRDSLWEIGSGANWLAYHVAVTLALHVFFLRQVDSPVPSFLVMDQPSQVYFPHKLAGAHVADPDPNLDDEDVAAVRRVFDVLAAASKSGRLQTIVLDHAGSGVWDGIEGVHLVEEWRDGAALVPATWL